MAHIQLSIPQMYLLDERILIRRAFDLAAEKHKGQQRDSNEPYIIHPVDTAHILMEYKLISPIIAAGLLHDVLEDTDESFVELEQEFGFQIAKIVNAVTKSAKMNWMIKNHPEEKQKELIHYFLEVIKDPRAALVKVADRLANMRTIKFKSEDKQRESALETLQMYAPLATELGAPLIAKELEDICMGILSVELYKQGMKSARKYRQQIKEKGYHTDKLQECIVRKR